MSGSIRPNMLGVGVYGLLTVLLPMPLVWALHSSVVTTPERLFLYDLGILAFTWWLEAIILASRLPLIERWLPLPLLYLGHGFLAALALIAATFHRYASFSYHREVQLTGNIAWWIAVTSFCWAVLMLSGALVERSPLALRIKRGIERFLPRFLSVWLHRVQWLMVLAIVLHVQFIPRLASARSFNLLFLLYVAVTIAVFGYAKVRARWIPRLRGKVIGVAQLDDRTWELNVAIPPSTVPGGTTFMLRFPGTHSLKQEAHPFSIASAGGNVDELTFFISEVGDFTSGIGHIQLGAPVYLEGPFGSLAEEIRHIPAQRPVVYIGLGAGIGPILSLLHSGGRTGVDHVLWFHRSTQNPYARAALHELEASGAVKSVSVHTRRLDSTNAPSILKDALQANAHFLIIGPPNAVLDVERLLRQLGVPAQRILEERLTM